MRKHGTGHQHSTAQHNCTAVVGWLCGCLGDGGRPVLQLGSLVGAPKTFLFFHGTKLYIMGAFPAPVAGMPRLWRPWSRAAATAWSSSKTEL